METVKVWIPQSDLSNIQENKRPTTFWLTKPANVTTVEISITLERLKEWQVTSHKQILFG